MNARESLVLAKRYEELISGALFEERSYSCTRLLPPPRKEEIVNHLKEILKEIPGYVAESRWGRIARLLSFTQGILWEWGLLTLNEITAWQTEDFFNPACQPISQLGAFRQSRFRIHRYRYALSKDKSFFTEVLEIENPPEGKGKHFVYEFHERLHYTTYEFQTLADAISAWDKVHTTDEPCLLMRHQPGFLIGYTSEYRPWFFAVREEEIEGAYVKEKTSFVSAI